MEYDLENPATWVVYEAPPCDPTFDVELLRIGGTNRDGAPNLMKVWGGTHRAKGVLVYKLCDTEPVIVGYQYKHRGKVRTVDTADEVPKGILAIPILESLELGELRWVIHRWVSPEELDRMGYFDASLRYQLPNNDQTGAAIAEAKAMVLAGEDPETAWTKVENQLDRARGTEIDQTFKQYFDPEWRKSGDYQFFFRLERADGSYHPPDSEALEAIDAMWKYNMSTTPAEREADLAADAEKREQEKQARIDALWHPQAIMDRRPNLII